jgi:nicotinamidase-related amidase
MDVERIREQYKRSGLVGRVGFGSRPAIVVVDFIKGLTDPSYPLGARMDAAVLATRRLLDAARAARVLIIYTTIGYEPSLLDAGVFVKKAPGLRHQILGTPAVAVDDRLAPRPDEPVLVKKYQSSFFGTPLASLLTAAGVDTCIVTGCVTSGCVRATAVDSMQHGFRTILPLECVADRAPEPHEANLLDIDSKVADVVSLEEALAYLASLPTAAARQPVAADTGR